MSGLKFIQASLDQSALFSDCVALLDRTQGIGVYTSDHLARCASETDRILLLALLQERLVGVASGLVLPQEAPRGYAAFGRDVVDLFDHHRVGSLNMASVEESWQGRGIGQELTRRRIKWLGEAGCTAIVGISWNSGSEHNSARVFRKLGFTQLSHAEGYYAEASLHQGFLCPVCGSPPCRCSATLFVRNLSDPLTSP